MFFSFLPFTFFQKPRFQLNFKEISQEMMKKKLKVEDEVQNEERTTKTEEELKKLEKT